MVSVERQLEFQNLFEPRVVKQMSSKHILFQFFRDQAESESEQGHEGGGVAEVGQKEEEKG